MSMTQAQQQFLDGLNALAREQLRCEAVPDGPVRLLGITRNLDRDGRWECSVDFAWHPAMMGERYADWESTAVDVDDPSQLGVPSRELPSVV